MAFAVHDPVSAHTRFASPVRGSAGRARHKAFTRAMPCHPRRAPQSLRNGTGPDRPPDYLLLHHYARQKGCRRSMSPFSNHCRTNSCVAVPSVRPSVRALSRQCECACIASRTDSAREQPIDGRRGR
uniref:Uncharacterized protein n=1 Tax=Triticum urartu TaxID=4572 RepID=A0A8R7QG97_TRIUA